MVKLTPYCFFLAISGCAYTQEYPDAWPVIPNNDTISCPDIDGIYENIGELGETKYKSRLASELFYEIPGTDENNLVKLTLTDNDQLTIVLLGPTGEIKRKTLQQDKLSCKGGLLSVDVGRFLNQEGVVAKEWVTLYMFATNDYLIVKEQFSTIGTLFFIPAAGIQTTWERYRRNFE